MFFIVKIDEKFIYMDLKAVSDQSARFLMNRGEKICECIVNIMMYCVLVLNS